MNTDTWIPTVCYMCYSCCGIQVRVVNGQPVEVRGDPDNPHNLGKLCAKGKAGLISLYDPQRVKTPLRRTNPAKGIGVDPGWKEISWEEALKTIIEKLVKIRREDPRQLALSGLDYQTFLFHSLFGSAFGTPNIWPGAPGYFCGNSLHPILFLTKAAFFAEPDFQLCNYCLLIGSQIGFMLNTNSNTNSQRMAEARARGMKLVVVDPVGTNAAAKADEWIPIRPGTDAAFALGVLNHLINGLGIYDSDFMKRHTNGPYLVGPDGYYVRDEATGKPLVWNCGSSQGVPYDQASADEVALEGDYSLKGLPVRPAFQALKEHVKKYTLERVASITSVPSQDVARVAEEFGKAARVGSKITIDGVELPFRPTVVHWNKGVSSHRHAILAGMAIQLLNTVVGAMDVPGGSLGSNPVGPFWAPSEGPDGLIVPARFQLLAQGVFPPRRVKAPESLLMEELVPVGNSRVMFEEGVLHPEKYGISYRPQVLINCQSNLMISTSNPQRMARVLQNIPFMVTFAIQQDETTEFADIVLPDTHYLERLSPFCNHPAQYVASGPGSWYWMVQQPVVQPIHKARPSVEVLLEIADRAGFHKDFNLMLNTYLGLKEPFKLEGDKAYSLEEVADIWAKSWFGPSYNLEWFRTHGFLISARKKIEEAYPRPFLKMKLPLYLEHYLQVGDDVKRTTKALGLAWDTSDYQPLPDWKPCPGFDPNAREYPFYAVNFRWPFHTFSFTALNPWLDDLSEHHSLAYGVLINSEVAKSLSIRDGDPIWVESAGGKAKGEARVTECVHPEVVGIPGTFGHWAKSGISGKGIHFNSLFPLDHGEMVDPVSGALDCCIRVRVYKAYG